ncbi:MAG TPA: FHA domain-containing protein [Pirellulales bacterium]|jgi:hypothetical protein|nr:FHA domain-containing protein [Pirellulales bacterium]
MKPQLQSRCQSMQKPARFWLWVDGVGGFLVCEAAACTIGQPAAEVEIGILADVSSRQAIIRRQQDDYLLEPLRPTKLEGRVLAGPALLSDRATIQLGESVRLLFRRPHPYSASACLNLASGHRTLPASDGILLAADSLVLGASSRAHVRCRAWTSEVVLYRQQGQWACRSAGPVEIDARQTIGGGLLERSSRIVGPDFSFSLEEAG